MNATPTPPVTVLGSGVALGVLIPALLVQRQLRRLGVDAEVAVIECLYRDEALVQLQRQRRAFHADFALARMTHRLVPDVRAGLDPAQVEALLHRWQAEHRRRFVVWSGFWLPVLDAYRRLVGDDALAIDLCRVDAAVSTSFKTAAGCQPPGREIWFWNAAEQRLVHELRVGTAQPLPFAARDPACVVHGGGWGIGNYRDTLAPLVDHGHHLHVVVYAEDEATSSPHREHWLVDPRFAPVPDADTVSAFPPMLNLTRGTRHQRDDYHALHDVIRRCRAIVSKPGGGTLIDSLAAATPVILLPPFGDAERQNGELWQRLGFGITYDDWAATGFAVGVLRGLHDNIRRRTRGADYVASHWGMVT